MRNFTDLYEETVEEKKSPSEIMKQRRKMGRRMKMLARKSSTKMKKKRNRLRRRDNDTLNRLHNVRQRCWLSNVVLSQM